MGWDAFGLAGGKLRPFSGGIHPRELSDPNMNIDRSSGFLLQSVFGFSLFSYDWSREISFSTCDAGILTGGTKWFFFAHADRGHSPTGENAAGNWWPPVMTVGWRTSSVGTAVDCWSMSGLTLLKQAKEIEQWVPANHAICRPVAGIARTNSKGRVARARPDHAGENWMGEVAGERALIRRGWA